MPNIPARSRDQKCGVHAQDRKASAWFHSDFGQRRPLRTFNDYLRLVFEYELADGRSDIAIASLQGDEDEVPDDGGEQ